MGALFLAGKIEECPRQIKDVINVFHWLIRQYKDKPYEYLEIYDEVNFITIFIKSFFIFFIANLYY